MRPPTRLLFRPSPVSAFLQPRSLLRLMRFRWRIIAAMLAVSTGLALLVTLSPYSARTVILVNRLGPGGVITNADCAGIPLEKTPN